MEPNSAIVPPTSFCRDVTWSALGLACFKIIHRREEQALVAQAYKTAFPNPSSCIGWNKHQRSVFFVVGFLHALSEVLQSLFCVEIL